MCLCVNTVRDTEDSRGCKEALLTTFNVPVVYMGWDEMILMWATSISSAIGSPELFWAQLALALLVAISGPKKS